MYTNKLDNIDEMDTFLEIHRLLKVTQEKNRNLKRPIASEETELIIKNLSIKKSPRPDGVIL